ncbi:hypothetical protein CBL93_01360, partial [Klebsiella pneumoniae]
ILKMAGGGAKMAPISKTELCFIFIMVGYAREFAPRSVAPPARTGPREPCLQTAGSERLRNII